MATGFAFSKQSSNLEDCSHCFWVARDPSHPLLEWFPSPHDGRDLAKKESSSSKITKAFCWPFFIFIIL